PMHARRNLARLALAAAEVHERAAVAEDQIEAVVFADMRLQPVAISARGEARGEKLGDEAPARARGRALVRGIAEVGDGGEAALSRDAHPGAARLEVAPGEDRRYVPPPRRLRGTRP